METLEIKINDVVHECVEGGTCTECSLSNECDLFDKCLCSILSSEKCRSFQVKQTNS